MDFVISCYVLGCSKGQFKDKKSGENIDFWQAMLRLRNGQVVNLACNEEAGRMLNEGGAGEWELTVNLSAFNLRPKLRIIKA